MIFNIKCCDTDGTAGQFWVGSMFNVRIVGTANAITAGETGPCLLHSGCAVATVVDNHHSFSKVACSPSLYPPD